MGRPAPHKRTTVQRGYGSGHRREKESWRQYVDAGMTHCAELVCLMPNRWIPPGTPWDLAHDRRNPGKYLGPAHKRCNASEGARYGNAIRRATSRRTAPVRSRAW